MTVPDNEEKIEHAPEQGGLLTSYKVLDLTNEQGFLCGRILADLGAEVTKIEKPGGDQARQVGPFLGRIPHPERSLYWFAYNANKMGITLDIETKDGQNILKRLVKAADIVIESFPPGYLDKIGSGYSVLSETNPQLIVTSITPFGQDGPYRDYKAPDIVGMAMGGSIYTTGYPDKPPVRISFPQAYLHAGAQAASATMLALYHRETTGEGQHVDVSMQQCVSLTLYNAVETWDLNRRNIKRSGGTLIRPLTGLRRRQTWACKDGYVSMLLFGGFRAWSNRALLKWMDEEGMANKFLLEFDWEGWDIETTTQDIVDQIEEPIANFFMTHTKAELYKGAIEKRILLFPVNDAKDILEDEELAAREFWQEVYHPELDAKLKYPGFFIKSSEVSTNIRFRAPLIGEHNVEVYHEKLGIPMDELQSLAQNGVI